MSDASWRRLERPPWNSWSSSGDDTAAHWSVAAWKTETPLPMCGVTGMLAGVREVALADEIADAGSADVWLVDVEYGFGV